MFLLGLVLIILGIANIVVPEEMYMLGKKWQFRGDVEPSDAAILFTRVGGVISILIGISSFWF